MKDAKSCHLQAVQIKAVRFSPPHLNVRKFKTAAKYNSNIKRETKTLTKTMDEVTTAEHA